RPSDGRAGGPSALIGELACRNRRIDELMASGRYCYETHFTGHSAQYAHLGGERLLMFAAFGDLGLIGHPEVNTAAKQPIDRFGAGSHGVPLIAGGTSLQRDLEARLADFVSAEDALIFSSGFVTNTATIQTLVGPGDLVVGDEYNHASIVDGCQASGATFR